jgi:hypothetical protein
VVFILLSLMRVNSTNVLDEGLRIGGRGRRMNSKVKISQTRRVSRISVVLNLAQSRSVPSRPLLALIYRWQGQGTDRVQYKLQHPYTIQTHISTMTTPGPGLTGLRGTQIMGSISYTLVNRRSGYQFKNQIISTSIIRLISQTFHIN